jgi:hypothetical protein
MRRNVIAAASAAAVLFGSLALSAGSNAAATTERPALHPATWCSTSPTPPCVVSVTRDGVSIAATDPTWDVSVYGSKGSDGEYLAQWDVGNVTIPGSYVDMGTGEVGHTWSVEIDMGTHVPRVTDEYGDNITVTRSQSGGDYYVTTTGNPVTMGVNADCTYNPLPSCPFQASQDVTTFFGEIGDFQQWTDSSQWPDFYGMDSWTNVEESEIPPEISGDPLQFVEQLGSSHELHTGAVFHGFYHVIMPNAFLVDMGIDDPSTLSSSGLAVSLGSGTGTASVTTLPSAVEVDATGLTFTHRTVKVKRGNILPTRPSKVHTRRRGSTHATVSFRGSRARGSHIRRYAVTCSAAHYASRTGSGRRSPVWVKGLAPGVAYRCKVRAVAKVGPGGWSGSVHLAARP